MQHGGPMVDATTRGGVSMPAPQGLSSVSLDELERVSLVGTGAKSKVWLVKHHATGALYCLKEIPTEKVRTKEEADHIWNERKVLTELAQESPSFPRCCKLHGTMKDQKRVYFLLEYIPGAPLHIHFQAARGFSVERARFYCAELVETLGALHERGIIYRDLKASNVIIDARTGRLRLVDFGFAKKLPLVEEDKGQTSSLRRTGSCCGTFHAMAPEVFARKPRTSSHTAAAPAGDNDDAPLYTCAADWWSLGILTFELLEARPPFGYRDVDGSLQALVATSPASLTFPPSFDSLTRDLIARLLEATPERRLGFGGPEEIKNHPWFDGFPWRGASLHAASDPAAPAPPDFDSTLGTNNDSDGSVSELGSQSSS